MLYLCLTVRAEPGSVRVCAHRHLHPSAEGALRASVHPESQNHPKHPESEETIQKGFMLFGIWTPVTNLGHPQLFDVDVRVHKHAHMKFKHHLKPDTLSAVILSIVIQAKPVSIIFILG